MDAALAVFTRAAYYCNDTGACKRFNSIFYFSPLPPLQKKTCPLIFLSAWKESKLFTVRML